MNIMNINDLNKKGDIFTRSLLEHAKALEKAEKVVEVTTSNTDTKTAYNLDDINRHKIDKTIKPIKTLNAGENKDDN